MNIKPEDENLYYTIEDGILKIEINLNKHLGISKSGKSIIVCSTHGQHDMGLTDESFRGVYMGMSVWRRKDRIGKVKNRLDDGIFTNLKKSLDFKLPL